MEFFIDEASIGAGALGSDGQWSLEWKTKEFSNGAHTITAVATDDANATASNAISVSVDNPTVAISLSATGRKEKGLQKVDLSWSPVDAALQVSVERNGSNVATTEHDGNHTDPVNQKGGSTYMYTVCVVGTTDCSNEATVTF